MAKRFPAVVLIRSVARELGVYAEEFTRDGAFMTAPIRIVQLPHLTPAHNAALENATRIIADLEPMPCVVQYEGSSDLNASFIVYDGDTVKFYKLLGGILLADEAHLDLNTWSLVVTASGQPGTRKWDRHMREGCYAWILSEAMIHSPDDCTKHYDAGHSIAGGKRIAMPAFDCFDPPDDPIQLAGYVSRAESNKQEIARMNHVFPRTTLTPADGHARSGYLISCFKCHKTEELVASGHTGSLPQTVVNKKFQQKGWKTGRKSVCPTCQKPAEEKPMPPKVIDSVATQINSQSPVAIEPPREMSPADKRKVFRAIDDQWDESKGRYIGAASDQHIADTLKVPRAWVREVREENFGRSQRNEELDKLIGEAKNLRAEAARNAATALDLATKFEKLDMAYQDMIRRLEAVE